MYSWELDNFVKERNNVVTRTEFFKLVNRVDNPQVKDVKPATSNEYLGSFTIFTEDGYTLDVIVTED